MDQATYPLCLLSQITSRYFFQSTAYLVFQLLRFTIMPCHHCMSWALTPRFHYHPEVKRKRILQGYLFSVALSVIPVLKPGDLPVRKQDALCCPDFPFLRWRNDRTIDLIFKEQFVNAKIPNFKSDTINVRNHCSTFAV